MSVLFYTAKNAKDAGARLIQLAESNKSIQETRRLLAARYASLYEGMSLSGLAPYGYSSDAQHYFQSDTDDKIPLIRNAAHSIIDTWVSKIAAVETPKPAVLTSYGNWSDRRIAKKLEQLVEAEFYEPQGRFSTLEELWIHAVRIAVAATGSVAVKVCVYPNEGKVSHEIHDTLTMFFDFGELTYGDLLTMGEVTWFDVERAVEIWGTTAAKEELIRGSIEKPPEEFRAPVGSTGGKLTEMVAIYEGWRGSHGEKEGRYCAAVRAGTLEWKPYTYARPPFVLYTPDPHLYGIFGHCITHHIYESVKRDNLILSKCDSGASKAVRNHIYVDKMKLAMHDALDVVEDDKIVDMTDPSAVNHVSAQGFHSSHKDLADSHWMDAHNVSGVPELHTTSKAQPGITAAIADRQIAARLNERFAAAQRRYVQAVAVDDSKLIIQALREVREHGSFRARLWQGEKFLREIDETALDLEDHKFKLRLAPVSGRANTPEGRLQLAFELRQMGILSDEGYAAVQTGYDTPEELDDKNVERDWIDNEVERWLFSSDDEVLEPSFYRGPLRFMRPGPAIERVIGCLLEAQMEELEADRQEFFLLFLADLDAILQAQEVAGAQAGQMPPPGAGMAPPGLAGPSGGPPLLPPGAGPVPPRGPAPPPIPPTQGIAPPQLARPPAAA